MMEREEADYVKADCKKLDWIYIRRHSHMKSKANANANKFAIMTGWHNAQLLNRLNYALSRYRMASTSFSQTAPTNNQLRINARRIIKQLNKQKDLLEEHFINEDAYHLIHALISAAEQGKHPLEISAEAHEKHLNEILDIVSKTYTNSKKLINWIEFITQDNFEYAYAKPPSRIRSPENSFIRELSKTLTEQYGEGGYWRNTHEEENSASGWRIDSLEHLISKIGIQKTRNQILESIV